MDIHFKIWKFHGGVHPLGNKELSNSEPAERAPLFDRYFIPLQQNIGAPPKWIVAKGDDVKKGQMIAEPTGAVSVPVHAPTSGIIAGFTEMPGATGNYVSCAELVPDGKDEWDTSLEPIQYWRNEDRKLLRKRIVDAGIIGMGGAAFPVHIKLSPPLEKAIDTLIVNGAECEPYLTADHRLMLERADAVIEGAQIAAKILRVDRVFIAVEKNKADAVEALNKAAFASKAKVKIVQLPVRYPQGGEKQLIYALTGRLVASGALPMDVGCVVQNVGTCAAIRDAVVEGHPLVERYVTITGKAAAHPKNLILRIGTTLRQALTYAGGTSGDVAKIILGGPMMGFTQTSLDVPVSKNTSGILLLRPEDTSEYTSGPCIRCGRCVNVCPMRLHPSMLSLMIESEDYEGAARAHVMDCIECGSCAYVCPAKRPLIQHFRRGKAEFKRAGAARKNS